MNDFLIVRNGAYFGNNPIEPIIKINNSQFRVQGWYLYRFDVENGILDLRNSPYKKANFIIIGDRYFHNEEFISGSLGINDFEPKICYYLFPCSEFDYIDVEGYFDVIDNKECVFEIVSAYRDFEYTDVEERIKIIIEIDNLNGCEVIEVQVDTKQNSRFSDWVIVNGEEIEPNKYEFLILKDYEVEKLKIITENNISVFAKFDLNIQYE